MIASDYTQHPVGTWNVTLGRDFSRMFRGAVAFDQDVTNWQISFERGADLTMFVMDATSFAQDLCASWGPALSSSDAVLLDLAFYGSGCPENVTLANLTANPAGPLCFDCGSSSSSTPTPPPIDNRNAVWQSLGWGDCVIVMDDDKDDDDNARRCIASHADVQVAAYASHAACGFRALQAGTLEVEFFQVESNFDWVTVRAYKDQVLRVSGSEAKELQHLAIDAGTDILWESDASVGDLGWRICLH